MNSLPETKTLPTRKRNRIRKLAPKKHQISHEFGRSTKTLWRQIITRSAKAKD
ncbi:MAG: hypothetical protein AAB512_01410 [Patescibacteria group bacterium]